MTEEYQIKDLLTSALQSPHGIALHTESFAESRRMRKRFYVWREQARREGQKVYDQLSFIIWDEDQLLIVPRQNAEATVQAEFIRPLEAYEKPKEIKARGKSKVFIT